MFIIFGWNHQTSNNYGPTLPITCPRCNNSTFLHLLHNKLWVTLFFIPVIPYESKYYLLCDVCGCGRELTGSDIDYAKGLNGATTAFLNNSISKEQYIAALNAGTHEQTELQN